MSATRRSIEDLDEDPWVAAAMTKLQEKPLLEVVRVDEVAPAAGQEHTTRLVKRDVASPKLLAWAGLPYPELIWSVLTHGLRESVWKLQPGQIPEKDDEELEVRHLGLLW